MIYKYIYISGPYTQGNTEENVRKAIDLSIELMDLGYFVYVPHLSHYQNIIHSRDYEFWMKQDIGWLSNCDALIRLPGFSPGGDRELEYAMDCDIPLVTKEELIKDAIINVGVN